MKWLRKFIRLFKSNKPKIGDIVVCLNDTKWNNPHTDITLIRNRLYKIYDIIEECHFYGYDIGARITPRNNFTICECGREISGYGVHWALASRFRKATSEEYLTWLENELAILIENEDFIKASQIQKEIDKRK